ncbi:hypothetical protein E4J89_09265 [Arthrobacter sp. CAU 1506]|uniref:hypothetical protein n=1 Tax=Arthrobacter sp. CAU 1506 TaxID=2560052 RepID=UPI0010ABD265|nr:hypothetical protein [Arthrobacter sp. CAU 1506]TJY69877.1 hypothetical protein E4J89_09265 [Arthrobacter sp. CAU 1506]
MSTPQNEPNKPGDGEGRPNGQEQPQYGQNVPQYGQNLPQYGQNAPQQPGPDQPQDGQNVPQYGQNAPQYGQKYGQNAPQYGQKYGQNAPQNASQYGQQPYGQGQQGQSPYGQQYGQQPYGYQNAVPGQYGYPSGQPQVGAKPTRPREVVIAFWLIIAAAALTAIETLTELSNLDGTMATVLQDPSVREALGEQGGQFSDAELSQMMSGTLGVIIVVTAVIAVGLYLLVAFGVKAGKNWARITGTVFAALSLFGLFNFWFGTLSVLLGIAAIVLLFLPASNQFFQATKAHKYGIYGR